MKKYTDAEMANLGVFGNYADVSINLKELHDFVVEIQKYLHVSKVHLENENHGYSKFKALDMKSKYELSYPEMLRRSTIISTAIILENSLDSYCNHFKKYNKTLLGYKELNGDLLSKFKVYAQKIIKLNFNFNSRMWQRIKSIYEMRNCLIHNNGSLINFGKSSVIKEFVKNHQQFKILGSKEEGYEMLETTFDGCIFCIEVVDEFFLELSYIGFEHFPGHFDGFRKERPIDY